MKRTSVQVAAVFMDCPHCGYAFTNSQGSTMFERIDGEFQAGRIVTCPECGKKSQIPAVVK